MVSTYNFFLVLPVVTTLFTLLFATGILVLHRAPRVSAEAEGTNDLILDLDDSSISCSDAILPNNKSTTAFENNKDEEDPMLMPMPNDIDPNFKAYVRADISSFYQKPPGSVIEQKPEYNGLAGKFINVSPRRVTLYWEDDYRNGHFIQNIGPWEAGGTASYPDHKFYFANARNPSDILCRFYVVEGVSVYYYDPYTTPATDEMVELNPGARGVQTTEAALPLTSLSFEQIEYYQANRYNLRFGVHYKDFTGGQEWLSMYPRAPPKHKMWRADYYGQEHYIQTKETHFLKSPPSDELMKKGGFVVPRNKTDPIIFKDYRDPGTMNITIKALSCAPRAFEIKKFLSDVEVDHILDLVTARNLRRSTTGSINDHSIDSGSISDTRTSQNTWLPRQSSPILDAVYRRAADVLQMDEALLRQRKQGEVVDGYNTTRGPLNEPLQIVHYDVGQQYTAHHDFGFPDGLPNRPSRSINLCMYLNEGMKGGQTSFPRWRNGESGKSIDVTPEKGKAMIFYMVNPDGNLDDLTQHAALPVISGEKWFANLWIWDPYKL